MCGFRCAEKILTQLEVDTFQKHSYNQNEVKIVRNIWIQCSYFPLAPGNIQYNKSGEPFGE